MPSLRRFSWFFSGVLPLIAVLAAVAYAPPAYAAMVFCNRTQGGIEVALGYRDTADDDKPDWVSEGWWRIEPGQCARVYGKPLTQRFYYYYAISLAPTSSDKSPTTWKGKYQFCTDTKAFRAEGDTGCESRNFQVKGFQEIDIGANTKDYTLDFHDGN